MSISRRRMIKMIRFLVFKDNSIESFDFVTPSYTQRRKSINKKCKNAYHNSHSSDDDNDDQNNDHDDDHHHDNSKLQKRWNDDKNDKNHQGKDDSYDRDDKDHDNEDDDKVIQILNENINFQLMLDDSKILDVDNFELDESIFNLNE